MKTMRDYLNELARLAEDKEPKDGKEPGDDEAPDDEEDGEEEQVDEGSYGLPQEPATRPAMRPAAIQRVQRLERP